MKHPVSKISWHEMIVTAVLALLVVVPIQIFAQASTISTTVALGTATMTSFGTIFTSTITTFTQYYSSPGPESTVVDSGGSAFQGWNFLDGFGGAQDSSGGGGGGGNDTAVPGIAYFYSDLASVPSGGSTNLVWYSYDTTSCTASGGWSGPKEANPNNQTLTNSSESTGPLFTTTTFMLSCVGIDGSTYTAPPVTVTVIGSTPPPPPPPPPSTPSVSITASPATVNQGSGTTLSWVSTGASYCVASGPLWSGDKPVSGSEATPPLSQATTFTITCSSQSSCAPPPNGPASCKQVNDCSSFNSLSNPQAVCAMYSNECSWVGNQCQNKTDFSCSNYSDWTVCNPTYRCDWLSTGPTQSCTPVQGDSASASVTVNVNPVAPPPPPPATDVCPNIAGNQSSVPAGMVVDSNGNCVTQTTSVNGVCGSSNNTCSAGTLSDTPDSSTNYLWSCTGSGGGTTASCSLPKSSNQPPTVSITSPNNGDQFSLGSNIPITASASDSDGTVSKVEFFANNSKIGEDASAPYSFTMSSPAVGSYTLFARATDNQGATADSSSITVSVNNSCAFFSFFCPPTVSLSANPSLINPGDTSVLSWNVSGADSCTASGGWSGPQSTSGGSTNISPSSSTTYILTCTNSNGQTSDSVTVTVNIVGSSDVCPNIAGNQSSVPTGYIVDASNNCVPKDGDYCPNLPGTQDQVPTGYTVDPSGNCVPVDNDYCANIPGVQSSVPTGMYVDNSGNCYVIDGKFCDLYPADPACPTFCQTNPSDPSCPQVIFCETHPSDPSCQNNGGGGGVGGVGNGGGTGGATQGFTLDGDTIMNVRFVPSSGADTDVKSLSVNPVGGFSQDVTVSMQSMTSKSSGAALPAGVTATPLYSIDNGATFSESPSTLLHSDGSGRYVNPDGLNGMQVKIRFNKPIIEPYNAVFQATGGGSTDTHTMTIYPNAFNPNFIEF